MVLFLGFGSILKIGSHPIELISAEQDDVKEAFSVWGEYISITYGGINNEDSIPTSVVDANGNPVTGADVSINGKDWVPTAGALTKTIPFPDANHIRIGKADTLDKYNGAANASYADITGGEKQVYTEIIVDDEEWAMMDGYKLGWHSLMHELGHAFGFDDWKLLKAANDNFKAIVDFYTPSADLAYEGTQVV